MNCFIIFFFFIRYTNTTLLYYMHKQMHRLFIIHSLRLLAQDSLLVLHLSLISYAYLPHSRSLRSFFSTYTFIHTLCTLPTLQSKISTFTYHLALITPIILLNSFLCSHSPCLYLSLRHIVLHLLCSSSVFNIAFCLPLVSVFYYCL